MERSVAARRTARTHALVAGGETRAVETLRAASGARHGRDRLRGGDSLRGGPSVRRGCLGRLLRRLGRLGRLLNLIHGDASLGGWLAKARLRVLLRDQTRRSSTDPLVPVELVVERGLG